MNRRSALNASFRWVLSFCLPVTTTREQSEPSRAVLHKFLLPSYPTLARQAGVEGKVLLTARISRAGTVEAVADLSGEKLFFDDVERCVRQWEFRASENLPASVQLTFQFILRGQRDQRCIHHQVSGTLPDFFSIEANPFTDTYT